VDALKVDIVARRAVDDLNRGLMLINGAVEGL
jgi:hypothetical protein